MGQDVDMAAHVEAAADAEAAGYPEELEDAETVAPQLCLANCGRFVLQGALASEPGPVDGLCSSCAREHLLGSRPGQVRQLLDLAGFGSEGSYRHYRGYSLKRVLEPERGESIPDFVARASSESGRTFGAHRYNRKLVDALRGYQPDERLCLYITGPTGVGKTAAVSALVQDLIEDHLLTVAFYHEADFYDLLGGQGWKASHQGGVLRHCQDAALLVLDEVGSSGASMPWKIEALEALMARRYHADRPTIFTSNLDVGSYLERFGEHVGSKLIGAIQGRQILLSGYDWRTGENHALVDAVGQAP